MKFDLKKFLILNFPYVFIFWFFNRVGEGYRLAAGADMVAKGMGAISGLGAIISSNPLPSFYPQDLLVGLIGAACIRAAVYIKAKNAKKYRHGVEYGSARWGTADDIRPFINPKFDQNILLTQTERVMVGRNKIPKYNINKNVLVIGGSGSGKTRFHIKPNLMQMNASYIVTDPKGTVVEECGKMLQRGGYEIKILNTINFKQSMRYNPFKYIYCENDILKLVNCIMENTKGEDSKGGEDFWAKAEALYYQALIAYIWYEAPEEEKNMTTLLEMLNASEVREDDENFKNAVDLMFEQLQQRDPEHFAVRQYVKYKMAAGVLFSRRLIHLDVVKVSKSPREFFIQKRRSKAWQRAKLPHYMSALAVTMKSKGRAFPSKTKRPCWRNMPARVALPVFGTLLTMGSPALALTGPASPP